MVGRVPVLGQDDLREKRRKAMDRPDDRVPIGNGKRASRAEVVLDVDDDEDVGGANFDQAVSCAQQI